MQLRIELRQSIRVDIGEQPPIGFSGLSLDKGIQPYPFTFL
jgi:hypothetical protein